MDQLLKKMKDDFKVRDMDRVYWELKTKRVKCITKQLATVMSGIISIYRCGLKFFSPRLISEIVGIRINQITGILHKLGNFRIIAVERGFQFHNYRYIINESGFGWSKFNEEVKK